MFSSAMLASARSGPICRTAMRHSRSRQISISEMFLSRMSMRRESARVPKQFAGQSHGFGDRRHRDFAAPGPNDALPRRAVGHLFQYLEDHDACALEGRLAVADFWIGDDVFAKPH